jgi:hypothetical protein
MGRKIFKMHPTNRIFSFSNPPAALFLPIKKQRSGCILQHFLIAPPFGLFYTPDRKKQVLSAPDKAWRSRCVEKGRNRPARCANRNIEHFFAYINRY